MALKKTIDVQAAVAIAAAEAIAAKTQGTFGVGGLMLDQHGNVLQSLHNNVIKDGLIFDPTAHGERQLIDWYYAERAKGRACRSRRTSPSSPRSIRAACAAARSWPVVSTWWWRRRTRTPASITTAAPASTRCRSAARAGGDSFSYPAILGSSLYARRHRRHAEVLLHR
jgi:cytosine deaminase